MKTFFLFPALALVLAASAGCASRAAAPMRYVSPLESILLLHQQGFSDEQLIGRIEEQRLSGNWTAGDFDLLRKAQVSDGVVRYLQGRAAAQRELGAYPYAYRPLYSRYSPVYLTAGAHHFGGYHHRGHH